MKSQILFLDVAACTKSGKEDSTYALEAGAQWKQFFGWLKAKVYSKFRQVLYRNYNPSSTDIVPISGDF